MKIEEMISKTVSEEIAISRCMCSINSKKDNVVIFLSCLEKPNSEIESQIFSKISETLKPQNLQIETLFINNLPITPLQQAMVGNSISNPNSGNSIGQFYFTYSGSFDLKRFNESWCLISAKTVACLTRFDMTDTGEISQYFSEPVPLTVRFLDLRNKYDQNQENQFKCWLDEDRENGFDVLFHPLIRCTIIQYESSKFNIVWTFHNATLDETSIVLLVSDVFAAYDAIAQKQAPILPERNEQFIKFILWKKTVDIAEDMKFWQKQLEILEKPLEIKCSQFISKKTAETAIKRESYVISKNTTETLLTFAHQNNLSVHAIIQAAWCLALFHFSDDEVIVFGSARGCRNVPVAEILSAAGMLVNTVPFVSAIDRNEDCLTFYDKINQKDKQIKEHEHVHIDQIRKFSSIEPGLPLFESLLMVRTPNFSSVSNDQNNEFRLANFTLQGQTGLPFAIVVTLDDRIRIDLEYNAKRFPENSADGLFKQFIYLLQESPTFSGKKIGEIATLNPVQEQTLQEWNNTQKTYEPVSCLHHFFEAVVDKTPKAIALVFNDKKLTYQELEFKANQLAHYLIYNGVTSDQPVAVLMERSLEMVISLYAILKAGGAYLPLDPEHPCERLHMILEEAKPNVLLTQEHLAEKIQEDAIKIVLVDSEWSLITQQSNTRPPCQNNFSDLAYIIYTSGSTGKPKGVMNEHGGICNRLQWMQEAYVLKDEDVVLQKTPYTFDVSVWEFFWPLMVGARLVIAKPEGHRDSLYLLDLIEEKKVTTLHFVPSMLDVFLEVADSGSCSTLRRVICSGEALPKSLQDLYFSKIASPLYNLYGPTEAAVDVTHWTCEPENELSFVPIGRPIANTKMYILNRSGQPAPIGVAGDLYIGGVQVARGYLERQDLTAERFLPDPFDIRLDARMYRTGDLARFLPDGNIEYLGREDFQVKFNGLRIELSEIEMALVGLNEVNQAVVICDESTGRQRLIAYLVLKENLHNLEKNLRSLLKKILPVYMIPQLFLVLESMPLSANGKLDRKALPMPKTNEPGHLEDDNESPSEQYFANKWKALLGLDTLGLDDRFFELGGTSLLAISFMAQLSKELGERLPTALIFDSPTVRNFTSSLWQNYSEVMSRIFPAEANKPQKLKTKNQHTLRTTASTNDEIAIVGMSGRFPGADNVEDFWQNLIGEVESIQTATDDELRLAGVDEDDINDDDYVRNYFSGNDLDGFDAEFFGYKPYEAQSMDPQHRLFLELAWIALDNAGYAQRHNERERIGVFGGIARDSYLHHFVARHPQYQNSLGEFHVNIGNDKNFPSTRVAYKLNLKGPAINVQTACSTAGVALHLACQNLHLGECDLAVVGGCRVLVPEKSGYRYIEGSALSSDGRLFTFDQRASGMVRGSGGAFVVLKRLSEALRDGDCIRGVIKSTAINNDGNAKAGFTAPSVEGQVEVISTALQKGNIDPETIGYIEAHGTGTALGDPIEVMALNRAYKNITNKKRYCKLGSVKTNVGHLDAGAATTSIIKVLLAMETGRIPASLNFNSPNKDIDFENSPFMVANKTMEWEQTQDNNLRRSGVSSLGLGGTNFHAIFEQAPVDERNVKSQDFHPWQLLTLSAKSETSLNANIAGLIDYIQKHPEMRIADLAYSLNVFRPSYQHRAVVHLRNASVVPEDFIKEIEISHCKKHSLISALVFSDYGKDINKSLSSLIENNPQAREYIYNCCRLLSNETFSDSLESSLLYMGGLKEDVEQLFILEYTLAQLWLSWGTHPRAVWGQGVGQLVAACVSGLISLEVSLKLLSDYTNDFKKLNLENIAVNSPTITLFSNEGKEVNDSLSFRYSLEQSSSNHQTLSIPEKVVSACENLEIELLLECGSSRMFSGEQATTTGGQKGVNLRISSLQKTEKQDCLDYSMNSVLGQLWLNGLNVDWKVFYSHIPIRKVPLPPYQFERQRHWLDLPGLGPKCIILDAETEGEMSRKKNLLSRCLQNDSDFFQKIIKQTTEPRGHIRQGVVGWDNEDFLILLNQSNRQGSVTKERRDKPLNVAFMFSGGGTQYLNMGEGLYEKFTLFRKEVDYGLAMFAARTGYNLKKIWFPQDNLKNHANQEMQRPSVQLPAIFILEIALAKLWQSWGVEPTMLIGHSLGENTAACLSGVLSYPDALGLVTLRGMLFEKAEAGAMLSVPLSPEEIIRYLGDDLDIATINSPDQCVISGRRPQIEKLHQTLEDDDIEAYLIPIQTAAHSRLLKPVLEEFGSYLESIQLHPPSIPFLSNVSGKWIKDSEATNPQYWVKHLRSTVRFADCIHTALEQDPVFFLETGPGKTLCSLVKNQLPGLSPYIVSSLRHPKDESHDQVFLLNSVCKMLVADVKFNWNVLRQSFPRLIATITDKSIEQYVELTQQSNMVEPAVERTPTAASPEVYKQQRSTETMSRERLLSNKLASIISEMSGLDEQSLDHDTTFINLGFDSLFLTQVNQRFKKAFKIKITLKQLLREAPTINTLAAFLDSKLPEKDFQDELKQQASSASSVSPEVSQTVNSPQPILSDYPPTNLPLEGTGAIGLQQAIALQIQASNSLLACLQKNLVAQPISQQQAEVAPPKEIDIVSSGVVDRTTVDLPQSTDISTNEKSAGTAHGPFAPLQKDVGDDLNTKQQAYLEKFIKDYVVKTKSSKELAQDTKPFYADPRTVMGFKNLFKEMTYTLAAKRSKGSRVWDIDDNEYVDCMGGFGAIFFGHAPDFVIEALHNQLDTTLDYGPQSLVAGRIARLICEFTGMDRASFCNTGSEAALAAMRIARTVTGNDLLVMFQGAYHGIFDEVLVRGQGPGGKLRNMPVAPGIPQSASDNILLLDYGDPRSLDIIKERADELAGVIVEPIQSRHPELQPAEFLKSLSEITRNFDIPLIFDEIITGFRLHPKGAQGWYGVEADIACYGKVIGGGLPIGVVAGKEKYIDALDGGPWSFGDDSFPEVGVTYFAGTFVRHPLALAATEAVLLKFKKEGPVLQERMNKKTAMFAERVNRRFRRQGIPIELVYFGSAFFVRYYGQKDYEPLFWHHLKYYGAHHIWGNRPGFLTVAHTEDDIGFLVNSFEQAGLAMQKGGFLPQLEDIAVERYAWTSVQSELWLAIAQGVSAGAAYNEQVMFEIEQRLDDETLELVVDKVTNRHPSFRARVADDEQGLELQHYMSPEFISHDLQMLVPNEQQRQVQILAQSNIDKPFEFKAGPLLRVLLMKLSKTKSILCVCASHLICDGWSLEIVMEDIAGYYTGISESRFIKRRTVPTLSSMEEAYKVLEDSKEMEESRGFWLSLYRDNIPPDLDLPLDNPRPRIRSFAGERNNYYLDASLNEPMRQFAKNQSCTSFVMMLSVYLIFLNRLTNQNNIVVGIPAAGQPVLGMPDLVAHNVAFLPLLSKIDTNQSFTQFMENISDTFMDAKDNQGFAYGEILKELKIPRDPSRLPLVTASFNMDAAYNPLKFNDVLARLLPAPRGLSKYDLLFTLTDEGDNILIEVDRNTDILKSETIDRWVNHYECLLREILNNPNRSIGEIPMMDNRQQQIIVEQWNDTNREYPLESATLHGLFEASVDKFPDRIALVFENHKLTYSELDERVNQLANYLRANGITTESIVAVIMDRSLEMVIALYAILKAGGAYLPLDPEYPSERIKFILDESKTQLILSQEKFNNTLPKELVILYLDSHWHEVSRHQSTRPANINSPADLAYVIYTSGSTGQPKGVMNEHRGICNRLLWMQEAIPLEQKDNVLQKTPYTFDVSVWEFFLPLFAGSCLTIAKPEGHKDVPYLISTIREHEITYLHFVPSMLHMFLSDKNVAKCTSLSRVICSGEALSRDLQDKFFTHFSETELHNLYGPTEAAVDVTAWKCNPVDQSSTVPIGTPVANTQIYILDKAMKPVPIGVTGELFIGGVQVARGYINRPELTDDRFITDPFFPDTNARLYKTGDLAKFRSDGVIEYIGRNDFQVKIRGNRVELGEIEAALLGKSGVKQCSVILWNKSGLDQRLVAFIIPKDMDEFSVLTLRKYLRRQLPEYMIPQHFELVEEFPLTTSGKLDSRSLLDEISISSFNSTHQYVAPESDIEKQLAALWQDIIGIETAVGAHDNFFDLGGHSMLAMQLIEQVRKKMGVDITPQMIMLGTLGQIAQEIIDNSAKTASSTN